MNFITSAFESLWAHITGLSSSAWTYIETYVLPVLKTDAGNLLVQLAPIALSAVTAAETQGGTSGEKFCAALAQIKTAAVSAGIAAGTSVLNAAIENAVQQLKASQATAGSASSNSSAGGAA